mgnify:CR=1 FL=1
MEFLESYSSSSQQASFNYHFAPVKLTSNGDSSVMFDIAVHKLKFRSGSISTMSNIGKYGILLTKLFCPTVRKNCSSDREKLLKFEAEGREFGKFLRSLE